MGLDQYLSANFSSYGGYDHVREDPARSDETKLFDGVLNLLGIEKLPDMTSVEICVTACYWRKANQIHKWFVDNCADGEDDCEETCVSREQLEELVKLCEEVLSTAKTEDSSVIKGYESTGGGPMIPVIKPGRVITNAEEIAALLPTQSGFFFGSTDYDEYYLQVIRRTVETLKGILNNPKFDDCTFTYRASW